MYPWPGSTLSPVRCGPMGVLQITPAGTTQCATDALRKIIAQTRDKYLGWFSSADSAQLDIVNSFAESDSREPADLQKALLSADPLFESWKAKYASEGTALSQDPATRMHVLGLLQGAKITIAAIQEPASSDGNNDTAL